MPKVKYSRGYTVNLGNYESERIDIGIELDIDEPEEAGDTLTWARKFVDAELEHELENIKSHVNK